MNRPTIFGAFLLFLTLLGSALGEERLPPGTYERTLTHGRFDRTYRIHLPPGYDGTKAVPLVLAFHGKGGTDATAEKRLGFDPLADRHNFIVVYPQGLNDHWNDGRPTPQFPNAKNIDDVGFISDLIGKSLTVEFRIDPARIYATGFSNGGFFVQRLGWELSDTLAAIAPVAGTMGVERAQKFAPHGPVSVIEFHGTVDEIVKYKGGLIGTTGAKGVSAPDMAMLWAKANGCKLIPVVEFDPDTFPRDRPRYRSDIYSGGRAGTEVVLVTMEGQEHAWPQTLVPDFGPGRKDAGLNAAAVTIWSFFEQHPKKPSVPPAPANPIPPAAPSSNQ